MADMTKSNPWFGISMALIGVIVGYGVALGTNAGIGSGSGAPTVAAVPSVPTAPADAPAEPTPQDVRPADDTDHLRGNPDAEITVIEYSDFECPFCARHHPTLVQLIEENDDVNWVYRHFPLSFHANAQVSAEASECVAELGGNDAFWKFADIVFEKGADKTKLTGYATEAGVSASAFDDCLASGRHTQKVNDQFAEGSASGVNGTPGNILINKDGETRMVSGAQPLSAFQAAIEELR